MPSFHIRHVTTYRYRSPVAFGEHRMLLRPRDSFDQRTVRTTIEIAPEPIAISWSEDASGNLVGLCRFRQRAAVLWFASTLVVEQTASDPAGLSLGEQVGTTPFSYRAEEMPELGPFLERQHPDPEHLVATLARRILRQDPARDTFAFLCRLNAAIRSDLDYQRREEPGIQDPAETLRLGSGTCRDFAVLMAEAVRSLGMAARFVSGYLHVRADHAARSSAGGHTHAWLQVYLPGAGWIDFDPTSGGVGNRDLVRVAVVRDPRHATPLAGSFIGFARDFIDMEVAVSVELAPGGDEPAVFRRPSAAA